MKKIPVGAEACNVLVGELDFLNRPVVAFVRLSPAVLLSGLAEVPIATRYMAEKLLLRNSAYLTQQTLHISHVELYNLILHLKPSKGYMNEMYAKAFMTTLVDWRTSFVTKSIYLFVLFASRFLFILLGPLGRGPQYHEIGRSMATLMTDEVTNVFQASSGLHPALNDGAFHQATFLFFFYAGALHKFTV